MSSNCLIPSPSSRSASIGKCYNCHRNCSVEKSDNCQDEKLIEKARIVDVVVNHETPKLAQSTEIQFLRSAEKSLLHHQRLPKQQPKQQRALAITAEPRKEPSKFDSKVSDRKTTNCGRNRSTWIRSSIVSGSFRSFDTRTTHHHHLTSAPCVVETTSLSPNSRSKPSYGEIIFDSMQNEEKVESVRSIKSEKLQRQAVCN